MSAPPVVGLSVLYRSHGSPGGEYPSATRAAIITEARRSDGSKGERGEVGLCVLSPTGFLFARDVPFAAALTPGCWSWPAAGIEHQGGLMDACSRSAT